MWAAQVSSEQSAGAASLVLRAAGRLRRRFVPAVHGLPGADHGRLLWVRQCQRLHALMVQVTVALGTVTFEFLAYAWNFSCIILQQLEFFSSSCLSWHLIFFIPVNGICSSLPLLPLGQTVSLIFLFLLPQSVPGRRAAWGPGLWESSLVSKQGPKVGVSWPGAAYAVDCYMF